MFTYMGCGTKLYGRYYNYEDFGDFFVTTKWITIFFFPIIPLRSYIVKPIGEGKFNYRPIVGLGYSRQYQMVKTKMNWKQVFKTYLNGNFGNSSKLKML